jgi:hypothetical protein
MPVLLNQPYARSPPKFPGDFDPVNGDLIGSQLHGIKG